MYRITPASLTAQGLAQSGSLHELSAQCPPFGSDKGQRADQPCSSSWRRSMIAALAREM
ncbi:hypothetical protein D3C78_558980 [compost metagenome]